MPSRRACMRKSVPVSISTRWPAQVTAIEGRVRRSRGSLDVQTRQVQPSVGTPMEVPLPRMVISALWMKHAPYINFTSGLYQATALDRAFPPPPVRSRSEKALVRLLRLGRPLGRIGNGIRDLEKRHPQIEKRVLQQPLLLLGEIALGLFIQHAEHVDALPGPQDVDAG